MKNIEKYYTNTESEMPRNNIKYFIKLHNTYIYI